MADPNETSQMIARYLAEHSRPKNLNDIIDGLGFGDVHRSTVWRWIKNAQELGLVEMHGDKKTTKWSASEPLLREVLRKQLDEPLNKRPRVPYQDGFLEDYVPNQTFYLDRKDRGRLHRQCPVSSAMFNTLPSRDQSLFLCGLSYASSSMEGNSYDFIDTEKLLVDGMAKEGATPEETTMVLNHHEAVRHMINNIHFPPHMNDLAITSRDVKEIHSLLSTHLLRDPSMCGAVRHAPVKIHQSSYIPLAVHDLIDRTLSTICHKAGLIEDPYEQAFFLLVHLPYLQPFEDCNKRTSRVICNIPLLRKGVAPMSWLDVDRADYNLGLIGIYERNNTSLLAEVFVDGYMHSTERFEIMQRTASPNEIQTRYRAETKQVIRSMILNGDNPDLSDIRPADIEPLHIHIERELNLLRSGNLGALVRYGLRDGDVESWMQDAGEVDSPRQRYTSSS